MEHIASIIICVVRMFAKDAVRRMKDIGIRALSIRVDFRRFTRIERLFMGFKGNFVSSLLSLNLDKNIGISFE